MTLKYCIHVFSHCTWDPEESLCSTYNVNVWLTYAEESMGHCPAASMCPGLHGPAHPTDPA